MPSNSPDNSSAASPPGPSSQSSSVGSCYTSSSSQAYRRPRPTLSDPSSSATSPASTYERIPDQTSGSALTKRHAHSSFQYGSQSLSATHTPVDSRFNNLFASPRNPAALSSHPSPRGDNTRFTAMDPPSSSAYETLDPRIYHRAGPSNNVLSDYTSLTSKENQSLGSPDNSHGPAPKARRTSPGGSRASGNLNPSHGLAQPTYGAGSYSFSNHSRSPNASAGTSSDERMSSASAMSHRTDSHAVAGDTRSCNRWQPLNQTQQHGTHASQASVLAMSSPRTRVEDGPGEPAGPSSASGTRATNFAYPQASASSLTDQSESHSRTKQPSLLKMDLATFAPQELLKILATLLHEIATANDEFQPDGSKDDSSRSRRAVRSRDRSAPATPAESGDAADFVRNYSAPPGSHLSFSDSRRPSVTTAALAALATPSSTLCFHARNVPSISIESYLLRILKYCPTTNEVFLSLLVYFDRMSRMGTGAKPGANGEGEVAGEAAGLPRAVERAAGLSDLGPDGSARQPDAGSSSLTTKVAQPCTHPGIRGFAIDSYNVHRLVIAGVTVASKFFSDVFYTNSRYAKVGGLPPHELNQLELQFLLLNDFRLTIPLEEMQRYADQLLMYASGRPDMVKMTKEVVSSVLSGGESAPASSHIAESGAAADRRETRPDLGRAGSAATAAQAVALTAQHAAGVEGDVQMSDAQK